jgi:hypothetical protein
MKRSAKILKFKNKKLKTVEEVRVALIAIREDVECGAVTVAEVISIKKEMQILGVRNEGQVLILDHGRCFDYGRWHGPSIAD